jgi:hypothetical protein
MPEVCLFEEEETNEVEAKVGMPQRKRWNKRKISELAEAAQPLELHFGEKLKEWFPEVEGFTVMPHANKFHRHDFQILHKDYPNQPVFIELESGKNQEQWQNNIMDNRRKWVYGLNVLSRKIMEGQHYHIFIKHNNAGNSFFACTYDFVQKHGQVRTLGRHSLGFETDSVIYAIPWSFAGPEQPHPDFCVDDPLKLKDLVKRQWTNQSADETKDVCEDEKQEIKL